ncbi:MAG: family protein phosphatase, partial [Actinomycetota bacterium]|nr:family protein phosphatase [Actinomycetota bacterium]
RTNNEDEMLVGDRLFAVADGMGGHAAGEVASLTAVEALKAAFPRNESADGLADAVREANRAVWRRAAEQPELRGMGTTVTATALVDDEGEELLAICNVGDSRGYLLRDGELDQITEDHSLPEEMVRRGELSPEEAATHPQRHILTRVLGMDEEIEVDCFRVLPYRGDRILLASDGLTNEVSDDQIASILRRLSDPEEAAAELVRQAKANGGSDNITVVVIDVIDDDDRAAAASAALASSPAPPAGERTARLAEPDTADDRSGSADGAGDAPRPPRGRRLTVRVVLFCFVLLAIVGGAVAVVGWYARGSYYVGVDKGNVAIFQGRPRGLFWFEPTLNQRTDLAVADVPPARRDDVQRGVEESSLSDARRYVTNLKDQAAALEPPPATTTTAPPAAPGPPPT